MTTANLPALLQRFFTDRLQSQLDASQHTVASYRDTFRLLFVFTSKRLSRAPSQLRVEDLEPALLGAFLDYLEHGRANTPRTRNTRLAAPASVLSIRGLCGAGLLSALPACPGHPDQAP